MTAFTGGGKTTTMAITTTTLIPSTTAPRPPASVSNNKMKKMTNKELQRKIDGSIRLLQAIQKSHPDDTIEIAYSGGKDSDVILQLAKEAGINYRAIYKNTTIDPQGTLKHVRDMGVEVLQPKQSFFQLIEQKGLPSRFHIFCCQELKEYKVLDVVVMGVRKAESTKRAMRYQEPTECRYYGSKKNHVEAVYPILEWSNYDVRTFIQDRGITLAPVYYDNDGSLCVERRLGCVGCPLASKEKRLSELKQYPSIVRAYAKSLHKFRQTHDTQSIRLFRDEYEQLVRDLFFDKQEEFDKAVNGGMFGDTERVDCKKFLENYFNIKF